MVSGLGRRCRGGCCTRCHEQLPEVIVGQLGPEVMHVVNTAAQIHPQVCDRSGILTVHLLCGRPHHALQGPEDWSNFPLLNKKDILLGANGMAVLAEAVLNVCRSPPGRASARTSYLTMKPSCLQAPG